MKVRNFVENYEQFSSNGTLVSHGFVEEGDTTVSMSNFFKGFKKRLDINRSLDKMFFSKVVEFYELCKKDPKIDILWDSDYLNFGRVIFYEKSAKNKTWFFAKTSFYSIKPDSYNPSNITFSSKMCPGSVLEYARSVFEEPQFTEVSLGDVYWDGDNQIQFRVNKMYSL